MMYVLALLLPPVAILLSGRVFQAVFNAMLWTLGLVLLLMPFIDGTLTWTVSVVWAALVVRDRRNTAYLTQSRG